MKKFTKCLKIILKSLEIYPVTFIGCFVYGKCEPQHFIYMYLHNFAIGCMIMLS